MFSKLRSKANIIKGESARNGLWILSERIVSVGITTIIMILSARYLGAENFGILSYGLTMVALFTAVMKLGLDSIMVNELINNKKNEGRILGTSIVLRVISSLLSIVAIGIILLVMNGDQPLLIAVAIIQSLILIFQAGYILDYWFQSKLKSKYVSMAKIAATLITSGYSAYLLITGQSLIWFALSTVITGIVIALLLLVFYKKQDGDKLEFSLNTAKNLLSKSHHFIVASVISLVYVQIDKLMIGNMIGNEQLGLYSAALMLCTAWVFVPDSIITSLRPGIIHAKNRNDKEYLYKLKRLYFLIFWGSAVIAGLISLAAPLLVPFLFGDAFKNAVVVTQIAVWFVPFSMLGIARGIWIVSEEKYKYSKYYLALGLIMNISLNLVLIPQIGIVGAAIATIITEVFTCFIAPLFFKETRIHPKIVLQAIMSGSPYNQHTV